MFSRRLTALTLERYKLLVRARIVRVPVLVQDLVRQMTKLALAVLDHVLLVLMGFSGNRLV